jgi:hypothetical protein
MRKISRRIVVALVALLVVGIGSLFCEETRTFGGIVIGAVLALGANYTIEEWKRIRLTNDLAAVLYHEFANRLARCCYDFKHSWCTWENPKKRDRFSIGKFSPEPMIVFDANADKLALFDRRVPSALMSFNYRLSALRRDIENKRLELDDPDDAALRLNTLRFAESLDPGWRALQALASMVPNAKLI